MHTRTHARTTFIHHPPLAGLSDVSVISCPARLNYDVNKSLLVSTSAPASRVREQTRTRAQAHLSESVSCNSCMNLTSPAAERRTFSWNTAQEDSSSTLPQNKAVAQFNTHNRTLFLLSKCESCRLGETSYRILSTCHVGLFQRAN